MKHLHDFKPIELLTLPGLGTLDCSGLILLVGPNSCGKTQLLRDLYQRIAGEPRELVVASEIKIRRPPLTPLLTCLESEGYIEKVSDPNGNQLLRPTTTYVGSGEAAPQIQSQQPEQWYELDSRSPTPRPRSEFQSYFGRFLVTGLFLERRLNALAQVGVLDFATQPPQQDLHALYLDDNAKDALLNETRTTFSKSVWPDASRGSTLSLRVSNDRDHPTAQERHSPKGMMQYRTIESEGDGLKSYVATVVALLLGRRPVCLVDEPEMCLHPPQAYDLGRFIGRTAASSNSVTFVATHSSHILRGVIQVAPTLQIVRLTRAANTFEAHLVSSATLAEALTKPTMRAEAVLDGIFAQAVVIVEADTDRTVYQSTWETLHEEVGADVHFAAVGGSGGIADTCALYKALRIPVVVIADLDVILDSTRLLTILKALSSPASVSAVVSRAESIAQLIRDMLPAISPASVKEEIGAVARLPMEWSKGDDQIVVSRLREIRRALDRMSRIKHGGALALPPAIGIPLGRLLQDLEEFGLFLVPVGELEEWLGSKGISASKSRKWEWANEAATYVRKVGAQQGDIWDFLRRIAKRVLRGSAPIDSRSSTRQDVLRTSEATVVPVQEAPGSSIESAQH